MVEFIKVFILKFFYRNTLQNHIQNTENFMRLLAVKCIKLENIGKYRKLNTIQENKGNTGNIGML